MAVETKSCRPAYHQESFQRANSTVSILSNTSGTVPVVAKPWGKSKVCHVCGRKLGKLQGALKHHCRFCGETVCSEHSQHSLTHPATSDEVRCCDYCIKSIIGKETRDEIERKMMELKGNIAEEYASMVRKTKEIEQLEGKKEAVKCEIEAKRSRSTQCLQIYHERIAVEKANFNRFQSMLSHNKSSYEYSLEITRSVTRQHAEKKAEYTEILAEVEALTGDVKRTSRGIIEKTEQLRSRIPPELVGRLLGRCCEPKYLGVSFNASSDFNVSIFKKSLRMTQIRPPEQKSCKCVLM